MFCERIKAFISFALYWEYYFILIDPQQKKSFQIQHVSKSFPKTLCLFF